jgi:dihydrolipoamide dehydrogenase
VNETRIVVPDLGETTDVEVVEILVSPGDRVGLDDPVIVLESDKASMDLPSPVEGVVTSVEVSIGDRVAAGTVLVDLDAGAGAEASGEVADESASRAPAAEAEAGGTAETGAAPEPPAPPPAVAPPQPSAAPPPTAAEPAPAPSPRIEAADPSATIPDDVDLRADVVVLGAGPGGYTAAFRTADLGLQTVLVERYPTLGGVCLNVGCIPSKALLSTAETMAAAAELRKRGVEFGAPAIDAAKLDEWKNGVVKRLTGGLAGLAKRRKVEVVQGVGRFVGPRVLAVETPEGGSRRIGFEHAIIAAGSKPVRLPDFPWDDPRIVDSTGALELDEIPRRLLVVGGGIIGLEMASVYDALGSQVTVVELLDELLAGCDRDIVRPLEKRIASRYHAIRLGTRITSVEPQRRGIKVWYGDESRIYDRVLVAVGRQPCEVDAGAAGVAVDERGFIPVDEAQRTNVPHIFAVGDITGPPLLAHRATHQGKVAAEVAAGRKAAFEASVIPSVAYTDPEIAWAGVTEAEAKAEGRAIEKASFPWAASGRAIGTGRDEGMTKLIFDGQTRRLVGAGIVGPHAGELISETVLAIEMGADPEDIALSIHPHPTLSETVNFAAEMVAGTITDLYLPRRK